MGYCLRHIFPQEKIQNRHEERNKTMKQLAIFDLDGTLVNSIADLANAVNQTLRQMHYPTHPLERFYQFVGNGVQKLCERALPENATSEDQTFLLTHFSAYYESHCLQYTVPYHNIPAALEQLKSAGIQLAAASNKPQRFTEKIIHHFFGDDTFAVICGSCETRPKKPAPDIIFEIMQQLHTEKAQTIFIGDSNVDIMTAANASISSIGCTWGFRGREELIAAGANFLADDPAQLPDLILHEIL